MENVFIGIDPGKDGGIAVLNNLGEPLMVSASPKIGTEFDSHAMSHLVEQFYLNEGYKLIHVCLEDIHATHMGGNTSSFTMGEGKGLWRGILSALSAPFSLIQPKEWQKRIWINTLKQYQPSSSGKTQVVDTKKTSLLVCKHLFPKQNLLTSPRCKKEHDGIVDALLIAYYCYLLNKGKLEENGKF